MPDGLRYIKASAHPLGQEIDLHLTLPEILPTNYDVHVLRKIGSSVTVQNIQDHFNGNTPTGIEVFILSPNGEDRPEYFHDLSCDNGSQYYYNAVVQDTDTDAYSEGKEDDATAGFTVASSIIDAKDKVITVLKRILKNVGMDETKHYRLFREYGLEVDKPPVFYVVRSGGQVVQRYIGALQQATGSQATYGEIDLDIIQIIWEDPSAVRRDKITNILRENKETVRNYLLSAEGGDMVWVDITMEGDAINQSVRDRIQITGMMTIACGIETTQSLEKQANSADTAVWAEGEQINQE